MPPLITRVLGHEVKVFPTDDDCAVHLRRHDGTGEDTSADRDEACERAFLVYDGTPCQPALSQALSFLMARHPESLCSIASCVTYRCIGR